MFELGIKNRALALIKSYLQDRIQKTVVTKNTTKFTSVWSRESYGVPHGSILGPTLFVVEINNLPKDIQRQFVPFAYDTSVIVREKSQIVNLQVFIVYRSLFWIFTTLWILIF